MARDIELAIVAADDAFKDAGLQSHAYTEKPNFDGTRFGCNIGAGLINAELDELTAAMTTARSESDPNRLDLARWGKDGMNQLTPLWLLKYLPNMLACHVTIIHQLKGPQQHHHLRRRQQPSGHRRGVPHDPARQGRPGHLRRRRKQGQPKWACCGTDCSSGSTKPTTIRPPQAVRPFDADAAGTALAEGGGLLILEELRTRQAPAARKSTPNSSASPPPRTPTKSPTPTPPADSYARAITGALRDAGLAADDVEPADPQRPGNPAHDRAELAGLKTVFGNRMPEVPMSLTKAQTGSHAAGSGVEAGTAVLAIHNGKIPPSVNTDQARWIQTAERIAPNREMQISMYASAASTASAGKTRRWCSNECNDGQSQTKNHPPDMSYREASRHRQDSMMSKAMKTYLWNLKMPFPISSVKNRGNRRDAEMPRSDEERPNEIAAQILLYIVIYSISSRRLPRCPRCLGGCIYSLPLRLNLMGKLTKFT